jgi:hypothetical protein
MSSQRNDLLRPSRSVWFAIFGGPAAWAVQGLLGWYIASRACLGGLSVGAERALEILLSVGALALGIAALSIGWRAWRRSGEHDLSAIAATGREDFLAATAVLVSLAFCIGMVWGALPAFILPGCERMR